MKTGKTEGDEINVLEEADKDEVIWAGHRTQMENNGLRESGFSENKREKKNRMT